MTLECSNCSSHVIQIVVFAGSGSFLFVCLWETRLVLLCYVPQLRLGIVLKRVVSSFHWPVCHYYLSLPANIQKVISFKHESAFPSVISGKLSGTNATFQNHDCKERSRICWISVEAGVFIARSFQSISVEVNPQPNEAHAELLILIILWCLWHMQLWCSTWTFKSILFIWLYANSITVLA